MKNNMAFEQKRIKHTAMVEQLEPLGWIATGMFVFYKDGKFYDLSAADIKQIDRIEKNGLFVNRQGVAQCRTK